MIIDDKTEPHWKSWTEVGIVESDAGLLGMLDDVCDAFQALEKVRTDEFVLARRALIAHWSSLSSAAGHRGLPVRRLEETREERLRAALASRRAKVMTGTCAHGVSLAAKCMTCIQLPSDPRDETTETGGEEKR